MGDYVVVGYVILKILNVLYVYNRAKNKGGAAKIFKIQSIEH